MRTKVVPYTFADGDTMNLYHIGEISKRLGRSTLTIRKWEIEGKIPRTPFSDKRGCRLYSEAMIRVIEKAAEEEHITVGSSFTRTKFVEKVHAGFEKLLKKYKNKNRGRDKDPMERVKGRVNL